MYMPSAWIIMMMMKIFLTLFRQQVTFWGWLRGTLIFYCKERSDFMCLGLFSFWTKTQSFVFIQIFKRLLVLLTSKGGIISCRPANMVKKNPLDLSLLRLVLIMKLRVFWNSSWILECIHCWNDFFLFAAVQGIAITVGNDRRKFLALMVTRWHSY